MKSPIPFVALAGLVACVTPADTDTDVPVVDTDADFSDANPLPPADPLVRLMQHVWDRYGADGTRGLDLRVPATNPHALVEDFPTGGNTGYTNAFFPGTYDLAALDDATVLIEAQDVGFEAGHAYTIELVGVSALGLLGATVIDDALVPPSSGVATVRLFLASPVVSEVDAWIGNDKVASTTYAAASAAFDVDEASVTLRLDVAAPVYGLPRDGKADYTCTINVDPTSVPAGWPPVFHVTLGPGTTTLIGATYTYKPGPLTDPSVQTPGVAPCAPVAPG